jgi:hypothetical protein
MAAGGRSGGAGARGRGAGPVEVGDDVGGFEELRAGVGVLEEWHLRDWAVGWGRVTVTGFLDTFRTEHGRRDETYPVSTEGGTRRVQLVRGGA